MTNNMPHIVVVGDVILDEYTLGKPLKLSEESPTIVASLEEIKTFMGGAALIARHLLRLKCQVTLVSCCGINESITELFSKQTENITYDEVRNFSIESVAIKGAKIPQKKRYFVNNYKLVQYDIINEGKHNESSYKQFQKIIEYLDASAIIVADNRHGFFDARIANQLIKHCKTNKIPTFVDCQYSQKPPNHHWFSGANYFFLNQKEFNFYNDNQSVPMKKKLKKLYEEFGGEVVVKMGENGAVKYFYDYDDIEVSPGYKVHVFDTCGAGDAFISAYVSDAFTENRLRKDNETLLDFANRWAALSCTKIGTIVPQLEELDQVTRHE